MLKNRGYADINYTKEDLPEDTELTRELRNS